MVDKSLYGYTPVYLRELLCKRPDWGTRADGKNNLLVPKDKRTMYIWSKDIKIHWPDTWNALPDSLKKNSRLENFKKKVKMHIFKKSFN